MRDRYILTFDYSGEHSLSKYPNCFSKSNNCDNYLPLQVHISDLGFEISDYTNMLDWMSMGMTDKSAQIVSYIASRKESHDNDWETFKQILLELPAGTYNPYSFNKTYKLNIRSPIHQESYKNIQKVIGNIDWLFKEDKTIYNIPKLLTIYKHVNINLRLNKGSILHQRIKARLLVGKVLEKLVPHLNRLEPVIVFEEADILVPALKSDEEYFSSWDWIKQYVLKFGMRAGCMLIFIVQDVKNCDPVVSDMYNYKFEYVFTPPFADRGVFSFCTKDRNKNPASIGYLFVPLDASSQYEYYPEVN
mgnify:CR=1 FL=1